MNGVVIAGTHSGCGKTTVALGLMSALTKKGFTVQPFKIGPDFIDPGLHRIVTGRISRNLDLWMCGEDYVKDCFYRHSMDVDFSIVEGVMGMYDGEFSTARMAKVLGLPIILVVDAYGMAESAGAIVKGFREYKHPDLLKGVIFNRVGSERHLKRLMEGVRDIPVLGYLPKDSGFEIPHRHLGLMVAEEEPLTKEGIDRLAEVVIEYIDLQGIIKEMKKVKKIQGLKGFNGSTIVSDSKVRIAVARDKAFCFYYEDNLDLLRMAGAELLFFSPLLDESIPEADALYIGGGYPELYAEQLSKNTSMLESIRKLAKSGMPIYTECGGLMYLSKGIHDLNGRFFKMASILPFETVMKKGRSHLGYRKIELKEDCIIGNKEDLMRGHEFHYSEIKKTPKNLGIKYLYRLKDQYGKDLNDDGIRYSNTLASYIHLHFGSNSAIASNIVRFIKSLKE